MIYDRQAQALRNPSAEQSVPPAMIEEGPWDILLALYTDQGCGLGLDKLANIASVPRPVMVRWLALLEQRELVAGVWHGDAREAAAVLTRDGRTLLDRYLSATGDLQVTAHF